MQGLTGSIQTLINSKFQVKKIRNLKIYICKVHNFKQPLSQQMWTSGEMVRLWLEGVKICQISTRVKHRVPQIELIHTNRVYFSQVLEEVSGTASGVTWEGQVRMQTQRDGQEPGCIRSTGTGALGLGKRLEVREGCWSQGCWGRYIKMYLFMTMCCYLGYALQATWPNKMDVKAAISWSNLVKFLT